LCDSGNGFHRLYRVDLPADDSGLAERFLKALAQQFDSETVKIDCKVFNPARIVKVAGTLARKGDSTGDRHHRLAGVLDAPDRLLITPREAIEAVAAEYTEPAPQPHAANRNGHSGEY